MPRKQDRPEMPLASPAAKEAVPLCRYEELAMRENRLRQTKAAKRKAGD